MSSTENLQKFLMSPDEGGAYTDEKLAALLAHAQDGKLAWYSCCCFIGCATADHALSGEDHTYKDVPHYQEATRLAAGISGKTSWGLSIVEEEYCLLSKGNNDAERRERLIPLILAEIDRRERAKIAALPEYTPDYRDEEGLTDELSEIAVYRDHVPAR